MRSGFPATASSGIMAHSEIEFRNDLVPARNADPNFKSNNEVRSHALRAQQ
jgi:hypothetical protein